MSKDLRFSHSINKVSITNMFKISRRKDKAYRIRRAHPKDIPGIVIVEFDRYGALHEEIGNSPQILTKRFTARMSSVADWYFVAETEEGKIVGSISAMPTDNPPEKFVSWEKSTNNGLATKRADNKAKYLYVINLDVLHGWTKLNVQYDLMAHLGAKLIEFGFEALYFESRIPGFRKWVTSQGLLKSWSALSAMEQLEHAKVYCHETDEKNEPVDRLLKFYYRSGFKVERVVANAFQDPESLNFGAIFTVPNPYRTKFKVVNALTSQVFRLIAKHPKILKKIL